MKNKKGKQLFQNFEGTVRIYFRLFICIYHIAHECRFFRIQEQLNSSSANYLLNTALGATGSSGSRGAANITDSSFQQEITPGSTSRPNVLQRGSSRERSPFSRTQETPPSDFSLHPP